MGVSACFACASPCSSSSSGNSSISISISKWILQIQTHLCCCYELKVPPHRSTFDQRSINSNARSKLNKSYHPSLMWPSAQEQSLEKASKKATQKKKRERLYISLSKPQ